MNEAAKFFWENRPTSATLALHDVMDERHRQMMVEGWTAKHDDEHSNGSMAYAAAAYAVASIEQADSLVAASNLFARTGWHKNWWKPRTPRRDLVRATALLLAEIERRDRADAARWKPCARCTTPDYCTNQLRGCDIAESLEAGIEPIAGGVALPRGGEQG